MIRAIGIATQCIYIVQTFIQGMTYNARFTFSVDGTTHTVYN